MNIIAINWANVGLQAGQLLLALSILVILHEFGHYITAKWFKCRVEKFFLFFDPWFALFKKKVGDTVYGIGWLPLGGYVKISGMIDESMDKEAMKQPPQEWEFRSKPAWQRLIVMLGGVIMNILVAFVIYAFILMIWGDKKIPTASMKYGVHVVDSTMYKMGIRNGDKILEIDGKEVADYEKLRRNLLLGSSVTVDRNGQKVSLTLEEDLIGQLVENRNKEVSGFVEVRKPAIVFFVPDTAKAYKAGLRNNDKLVAIDSVRFEFYDELQNQLNQKKNKTIELTVVRDGQEVNFPVAVSDEGKIGFAPYGYNYQQMDSLGWVKLNVTKYSFFAAFPAGVKKAGNELMFYIDQFKKILNPKTGAYKGVGGFKAMGSIFPKYGWDWEQFWRITAFLSIVLAFMNLLPIPALDGGHVMFTLYEMITRRKPNEKFLEYAQVVGMVLLLGLMLYANGNDWFGWGK
ncbi:MAG TPA: RIP metalloprotease RseP [Chitinophagaceae bacterium]|nr:RIP metalloprotease RseP [Chitinophagaceae bacterium]HQV84295.1 RIP metalloprotease RseP [Chitinophagaceae bacterium]HQX71613.1 RIP metalloprotease RseP [Chitinophagaceae bacterium]